MTSLLFYFTLRRSGWRLFSKC